MAYRATHCKIGILVDTGKLHKPLFCVLCRNVRTVEGRNGKKEGVNKPQKTSEAYQTSGNVAAVESDEQTVAQWDKLRDTVSGIRASVGNMSLPWQSDSVTTTDEKTRHTDNNLVKASEVRTKEGTSRESSVTKNEVSKDTTSDQNVYMNKKGEEDSSMLNARWVDQILEIQEERDKELSELDNFTRPEMLVKSSVKEKLDDPLAETNTQPVSKQKEQPVNPGIVSKMTFSYFSKANKSGNAAPTILNQISKSNAEAKLDQAVAPSASTIDWIKDAVGMSSAKKNASTSTDVENSVDSLKETFIETVGKDAGMPKTTNGTDADKSYWNVLSNLQQSILVSLSLSSASKAPTEVQEHVARNIMHSELESESGFARRTRSLTDNLVAAESNMSKTKRLDELCLHLTQHPQFRHIAVKHNVVPSLLKMRASGNPKLIAKANETMALIGYIPPPQGRGIKMLSIDGGGTRGLIAIEILQRLERLCNQPVNQMFDFVIGSSTGALLASLIFLMKVPLPECKELYLDRSAKMFVKESLLKKTRNMALHDVSIFEDIVRTEVGESSLIGTSRDPTTPKMAITSTLANIPKWKTFMFRNYNHPPGVISDYQGSCNIKIWEAIRASSSAPIYYSPFQIGNHVFRDGGLLVNNPTAAGLHECKVLWPHESLQCVLSLGNGRYDPNLDKGGEKAKGYKVIPKAMKDLADGLIDSATETEGVHMILKNTLDPGSYFRLSPYLKENYDLSEVQPQKIKAMLNEADEYMAKNELLMQKVVERLKQDRLPNQRIADYAGQRRYTHEYLFFKTGTFTSHRKHVQ